MILSKLRKQVCEANLKIVKYGLVVFTWGNVSAIDPKSKLVVIKPSGVDYNNMKPEDMVVVDLKGNIIEGNLQPSSDTPTHIELYKKLSGIGSVVHTHSTWATSFAQNGMEIPAFGTTHADYFYGAVPCTRKMTSEEIQGDYELNTGKLIVETFKKIDEVGISGVLVCSHGPFVWGKTLQEAVRNAVLLEKVAEIAHHTIQLGNAEPISQALLDKHFLRKHGKNKYYGQQ
jgi:L-ribulose-5-phosphate 4-epimerase